MAGMNSFDRVISVLDGRKDSDRIPCIGAAGTYTRDFMKEYDAFWPHSHREPEKMARLASAAHRLTGLDNVTVPFDLVVEAEALGAPINYFEEKVRWPSAKSFTVKNVADLKIPSDISSVGRIPAIAKAIRILKQEFEGKVPVFAYVNAPFTSISSYLVETSDFLIAVKREPDRIKSFYESTWRTYAEIAKLYREAGADIITYREEACSTTNLAPKQFEEFVKPYLSKIITTVGGRSILHICGATDLVIEKMIACGPSAISIDENTPMKQTRQQADTVRRGYPICGNVAAYSVIATGSKEKISEAVKNSIQNGTSMVSPGCDFFLETPTENFKAFVEATVANGTPPPWNN